MMIESTKGVAVIAQGQRVAQLLLLPVHFSPTTILREKRGEAGFGSSGKEQVYWIAQLDKRPTLELKINDKIFKGVLDTGADVSVISSQFWPKGWPQEEATALLQGLGQVKPARSAQILLWQDQEGHKGHFQPYIVKDLPTNLWGRDILEDMGAMLLTQPLSETSPKAVEMMKKMGWNPQKGLGRFQQGRIKPVLPEDEVTRQPFDRTGLGKRDF